MDKRKYKVDNSKNACGISDIQLLQQKKITNKIWLKMNCYVIYRVVTLPENLEKYCIWQLRQ